MRRAFRVLERAFAITGAVLVLGSLVFDVGEIRTGSMQPSLAVGDRVLVEKVSQHLRRPRRWEVVAFDTEEGIHVVKRVAGLPGEKVSVAQGGLLVDGERVGWPKHLRGLTYYAYGNLAGGAQARVGDGYYLLGDDSRDSQDSRFEGPLPAERVQGRAWLILWPLSRAGRVP